MPMGAPTPSGRVPVQEVPERDLARSSTSQDAGEDLGADEAADLVPVGEVPAALGADERQEQAGHVLRRLVGVDARPQRLPLEVGLEEAR